MKAMQSAVLVAMVSAMVGAGSMRPAAQTGDPDIDKLRAAYIDAWNQGDAEALANLHSGDAIRMTEAGTSIGRDAIKQEFAAMFSGDGQGTKLAITPGPSHQVTDEMIVNHGTFEITGGETPISGRYVNTAMRRNGMLRITTAATFIDE